MGRILLLSGLPGSGKSTLARALCDKGRAVHLRVDTIEKAISDSAIAPPEVMDAGYLVAAAQSAELSALGHDVVCDAVNADARGRAAWPPADLIIRVRVPEDLRAARIAQRGFPAYPHVWEDWPHDVLEISGDGDPDAMAETVWSSL